MRFLRHLLVVLALALPGVALAQAPAQAACRCTADVRPGPAAQRADVVFTGVLVEQNSARRQSDYVFEVQRVYQGDVVDSPVEVVSRNNQCGLGRLRADRAYVVFASENGSALRSDRCAGTGRAVPAFVNRVERALGPGKEFRAQPEEEEQPPAEFTRVDDSNPPEFTRLAAPGAALVIVGVLGLLVFRRRG